MYVSFTEFYFYQIKLQVTIITKLKTTIFFFFFTCICFADMYVLVW